MREVLTDVMVTLAAFLAMEGVAWFTHKYVMHGILWNVHRDHHTAERQGRLERNDLFFLFFAIPGIVALTLGMMAGYSWIFFAGAGITLYGATYFLVHDVFIHRRLRFFRNTRVPYLIALRRAHKAHHKNTGKYGGTCFGMLLVPFRFYREAKREPR